MSRSMRYSPASVFKVGDSSIVAVLASMSVVIEAQTGGSLIVKVASPQAAVVVDKVYRSAPLKT